MNKWECDYDGCTVTATGTGGAIGLLAIGWWFKPIGYGSGRPALLCPAHRPDSIPCTEISLDDDGAYVTLDKPCSSCRADEIAAIIQHAISAHYEQLVAWDAARRLAGEPATKLRP